MEQLLDNFDLSSLRVAGSSSFQAPPRSMAEPLEQNRDDWQAWQMQKELALLAASAPERWRVASHGLQ
jgi:hypothetical protein